MRTTERNTIEPAQQAYSSATGKWTPPCNTTPAYEHGPRCCAWVGTADPDILPTWGSCRPEATWKGRRQKSHVL